MENKTDRCPMSCRSKGWADLKTRLEATIVAAERQLAWDREQVRRSEATLEHLQWVQSQLTSTNERTN